MDKLLIRGGKRLSGEIVIAGAKNAALPILCAGLLTADTLLLSNVPKLQDVATMQKLLRQMAHVQVPQQSGVNSDLLVFMGYDENPIDGGCTAW